MFLEKLNFFLSRILLYYSLPIFLILITIEFYKFGFNYNTFNEESGWLIVISFIIGLAINFYRFLFMKVWSYLRR